MANDLIPWERPLHQPGGGDPMLFLAVYGAIQEPLKLERAKYRSNGSPSGVQASKFTRGASDGVFASFLEAPFDALLDDALPELADTIRGAPECFVIKGSVSDPADLNYLRDVIGMVACMVDAGGIAVFDMQSLQWWNAAEWRTAIFENDFEAIQHVSLMGSVEDPETGTLWLHTRGMRKFGRPDLSVHGVTPDHSEGVVEALNRFIEGQARGMVIPEGQAVKMAGIPAGTTCHHGGSFDDEDFNNVHVEVRLAKG